MPGKDLPKPLECWRKFVEYTRREDIPYFINIEPRDIAIVDCNIDEGERGIGVVAKIILKNGIIIRLYGDGRVDYYHLASNTCDCYCGEG